MYAPLPGDARKLPMDAMLTIAPPPLSSISTTACLNTEERAAHVYVHDTVEGFQRQLVQSLVRLSADAGVVRQHIEPTVTLATKLA